MNVLPPVAAACLSAALCLSSAALTLQGAPEPQAHKRRARVNAPATPGPAPTPAPPPTPAPTPDSTPTPEKKNGRPDAGPAGPAAAVAAASDANRAQPAAAVRYEYEFVQPDFSLHHIGIAHDAAGRGQISFQRTQDDAPLIEPLEIAPAALARIAAAWAALNFLASTESYQAERQMAHLGTMRLRMSVGGQTRTAEFNWTHNQQAAALASEYRRLADQQLFVFEINVARQYQPSDTVKLLRGLELLLNRNGISDGAQLVPLLTDLATDERIPLIARNQAARLSKKLSK